MIEENVKKLFSQLPEKNAFGEKITVVAAVKTQTTEDINRAVKAGITDIGDNHVQEFRDKYDLIEGSPKRHFIGHLQTNKIKYLLGRTDLYHSIDRFSLAEELSKKSVAKEIISRILLQFNIGNEETKGGFETDEYKTAYNCIKNLPALQIEGIMAMLPYTDDKVVLMRLAQKTRRIYDELREKDENFKYLSMGMSGDYEICIEAGSNMIRLGTSIFGARNYKK